MEDSNLTVANRQLVALCRGLASLDAVKEGVSELIGFVFVRDVQWRLVLAAVAAGGAKLAYDKIDKATAAEHGVFDGMAENDANARALDSYRRAMEDILDKEVTIADMPRFTLAELLDRPPTDDKRARKTNPITQSTLHNLAPILTEK